MPTEVRAKKFHPNIVSNFRQNCPELADYTDDQIYDAYELWATSDDYPDEHLVKEWIRAPKYAADADEATIPTP